jgi:RNA polymerase subunit RPABC4/transcription elongation factor Spt4
MSPVRKKGSAETTTCPWCSAAVPVEAATCPSCGASLREAAAGDILGVTQVDPAAISRSKGIRSARLAGWLGGDQPIGDTLGGKVEPPSEEVRREMLRLELAAIDAELEAKAKEAAAQQALPPDDGAKAEPG